jgi:osmoprotectant transport system ATP-binding protein
MVEGNDVRDLRPEVLRRKIGYVIQYIGLFPHMTVADNIGIVPRLLGWSKERIGERVDLLLGLIGLEPAGYRGKYPRELSGGEAQRIGVARALAADPPLLLMDEPFGAVDPLNREVLQSEFLKIQRELKKTVIFVTHDLDEAIRIADRVVLLRQGSVVQHDTPERILASPLNKFVNDFVGSDRALKRLSRFEVSMIIKPPVHVTLGNGLQQETRNLVDRGMKHIWVVDSEGRLKGWINAKWLDDSSSAVEEAVTEVEPLQFSVRENSSLREALSRMLGQGVRAVPVIDREQRVVGEVTLMDIEKITEQVDSAWKEQERNRG